MQYLLLALLLAGSVANAQGIDLVAKQSSPTISGTYTFPVGKLQGSGSSLTDVKDVSLTSGTKGGLPVDRLLGLVPISSGTTGQLPASRVDGVISGLVAIDTGTILQLPVSRLDGIAGDAFLMGGATNYIQNTAVAQTAVSNQSSGTVRGDFYSATTSGHLSIGSVANQGGMKTYDSNGVCWLYTSNIDGTPHIDNCP